MKTQVESIYGAVQNGRKNPGSGIITVGVKFSDGSKGLHKIYASDRAKLDAIKVGDVVDLQFTELAFLA